jgi:L,D-transpeptidase YcbB
MALVRAPWHTVGFGRQMPLTSEPPAQVSRRATIAGGIIALAAACALSACADDPDPEALAEPAPAVAEPAPQAANTELGDRIDGAPDLVIAGEQLNVGLLQRFYARHGFEPIWSTRQAQANSLVDAVLRAGDQGLDPELFHANLLRQTTTLPPLDRELLLSDAFLSYADALARGAVPVERRGDDETLTPEPIDVPAALDAAIDSPDPAAVIEALAPTTATYRALRQVLQVYRAGTAAAVIEELAPEMVSYRALRHGLQRYRSRTPAGDTPTTNRLREIVVNLERQRWLPRRLPADRVWVNVADERVILYRADQPVFSTRVIVGEDVKRNQSPEFRATIEGVEFNPPWNIPSDIAALEILPKIRRDPNYLTQNHMVILPDGGVEQLAGPDAGLGQLMFYMPNRFEVYLHDTPDKYLFNRDNRRISHGCIRVQEPRELAALLMQKPIDTINQEIAMGSTTLSNLPPPVPVFVVYQTAFVDTDGKLQFRRDFYNRDAEIWQQLQRRRQGRDLVAQADNRPTPPGPSS